MELNKNQDNKPKTKQERKERKMKKILTVSLFAIMAVGAANADIASTEYVTGRTGDTSKIANIANKTYTDLTSAVNALNAEMSNTSQGQGAQLSSIQQSIADMDEAYRAADSALAGRVTTAEGEIDALQSGKADKATTLAGYGITDAMTKTAIEEAIGTAKGEAIEAAATATGNVIGELDSSAAAASGSVLTGVTITDGKITAKQEMALTALANFPVECATSHCALTNNGTTLSWEIVQ